MAREGQLLKLPGGWFGKVTGKGDDTILTLFQTFNNQPNGRVKSEIRLEKTDTHDLYCFLEENDCAWLAAEPEQGLPVDTHEDSGGFKHISEITDTIVGNVTEFSPDDEDVAPEPQSIAVEDVLPEPEPEPEEVAPETKKKSGKKKSS
jgi:hypothetical protein